MTTTATTTSRPQVQETAAVVAAIIDAAVPADQTPARRFLARHWIWPPYGIGPDLPSSVLWLPLRSAGVRAELVQAQRGATPPWAARDGCGAVVYCWGAV